MLMVAGLPVQVKVAAVLAGPAAPTPTSPRPGAGPIALVVGILLVVAAAHLARQAFAPFAAITRSVVRAALSAMLVGGALVLVLVFFLLLLHR